jgi:hypothetical protein
VSFLCEPEYRAEIPGVTNVFGDLNIDSITLMTIIADHLPGCSSVNTMKDKNKGYSNKTIEQLMKDGYDPCKRCKP